MQFQLPRLGPVLRLVLPLLLGIWLLFALAVNWGGAAGESFLALTANTPAIAQGEVWRLVTAPLLHVPSGTISHILSALFGLYFLGATLEQSFGSARFARFLLFTGVLSYGTQALIALLLPASVSAQLVPGAAFGAMPVVEAIAIAWALSFRDQTVQLFFVLPVSSRDLIFLVIGLSLMTLISGALPPSGHIALFAGMFYGYLLGGGTPSPLRRLWLRYRLARLDAEARSERRPGAAPKPKNDGRLRVIEGGRHDEPPRTNGRTLH